MLSATGRRRFLIPAIILIVAGAILWLNAGKQRNATTEIVALLRLVCSDIVNDRNPAGRINAADPLLVESMIDHLGKVISAIGKELEGLGIIVASGDVDVIGNVDASHTAMIRVAGVDQLGVRLIHADGDPLRIIGIWFPDRM